MLENHSSVVVGQVWVDLTVRILECRADAWVAGASKAVGACRDMSGHELPLWHGVPANSSEVQRGSARVQWEMPQWLQAPLGIEITAKTFQQTARAPSRRVWGGMGQGPLLEAFCDIMWHLFSFFFGRRVVFGRDCLPLLFSATTPQLWRVSGSPTSLSPYM